MAKEWVTEKRIKCVVVGDGAVGKTCMLMSYSRGVFPEEYVPTVFDNYAVSIPIRGDPYDLCIFDTAGQEQYDRLRVLTYPKTDLFLICFSLSSPDSLQNVKEVWVPEIKHHCPRTPFILVGTKLDLRQNKEENHQYVNENFARKVAKEVKASHYKECSALTQEGLHDVFNEAILTVVQPPKIKKRRLALLACCGRN